MAIFLGDGAVSAPSLRFDSDQDTGFYKLGSSGTIGVASNGAGTMRFGEDYIGFGPASYRFDSSTNALVLYNGASGGTEGTFFENTPGGVANRTVGVLNNGNLVVGGTLPASPNVEITASGDVNVEGSFSTGLFSIKGDNTETVVGTVATQISTVSAIGSFYIIKGQSTTTTDRFMDLVFASAYASPVVIQSYTVRATPAARTYSYTGGFSFELAMASDTYNVRTFRI